MLPRQDVFPAPNRRTMIGGRRAWVAIVLLITASPAIGSAQSPITRSGHVSPDMAALAKQAMITLRPPPAWNPATPALISTIEEIKAEFGKVTDTPPAVNFVRTSFLRPDNAWLTRFKDWFRGLEKPLKLRFENQAWDCDNYANCFVAFADLLTLRAGETRGAMCVGWATVYYERAFAGINRGAHAVVIVATREGLFVIEPQNGTTVPLREFPNRHTIENVYF